MHERTWCVALICLSAAAPGSLAAAQTRTGRIAFNSYRDGNSEVYVINADGGGLQRLTSNDADDTCPAWSPDGRKIAFTSDREGNAKSILCVP